jgi:hypothetical protein
MNNQSASDGYQSKRAFRANTSRDTTVARAEDNHAHLMLAIIPRGARARPRRLRHSAFTESPPWVDGGWAPNKKHEYAMLLVAPPPVTTTAAGCGRASSASCKLFQPAG